MFTVRAKSGRAMGRYATKAQAETRRRQLARQAEALRGHRFGRGRRSAKSPAIPAVTVAGQGHAVHVDGRGRAKPVKNLGWLLRNWKVVNRFEVTESPIPGWDALLIAYLDDGGRYESTFASKSVLKDFLHRPVFRGVTLYWFGNRTTA